MSTPADEDDPGPFAPRPAALNGASQAYEQIRTAIVEGQFPPGSRLVEQRIGEMFSFSRTPVREAIRRLEAEGLVITERNRGAMVRPVTVDDIVDAYDLRSRLESYAAEMAAVRMEPEEISRLTEAVDAFGRVLESRSVEGVERIRELAAANGRIHDSIVRGTKHTRLAAMLKRSVDVPLVFQNFRHYAGSDHLRSDLFHRLIADAIGQRAAGRAGRLMAEHVLQGRDVLLSVYSSQMLAEVPEGSSGDGSKPPDESDPW